MANTPQLDVPHIAATDTGKVGTFNTDMQDFDTAFCAPVTIDLTGLTTYTLTATTIRSGMAFFFTGALTADCVVTMPAVARFIVTINDTTGGFDVQLTF